MLLYTISATGQVAINISVFVRLMLLWPKAVSTEFAGRGERVIADCRMQIGPVFVPAGLRRGRRQADGVAGNAFRRKPERGRRKRLAGMTKSEDRMTNQARNLPASGGSE